jgi:hypothetical protein
MQRRFAIEPVIGHLKNKHRKERNYLHNSQGHANSAILAAVGYNFRLLIKWPRILLSLSSSRSWRRQNQPKRKRRFFTGNEVTLLSWH